MRATTPGQRARLTFEPAEQDGFAWRAVRGTLDDVPLRAGDVSPRSTAAPAFRSRLEITFD